MIIKKFLNCLIKFSFCIFCVFNLMAQPGYAYLGECRIDGEGCYDHGDTGLEPLFLAIFIIGIACSMFSNYKKNKKEFYRLLAYTLILTSSVVAIYFVVLLSAHSFIKAVVILAILYFGWIKSTEWLESDKNAEK